MKRNSSDFSRILASASDSVELPTLSALFPEMANIFADFSNQFPVFNRREIDAKCPHFGLLRSALKPNYAAILEDSLYFPCRKGKPPTETRSHWTAGTTIPFCVVTFAVPSGADGVDMLPKKRLC